MLKGIGLKFRTTFEEGESVIERISAAQREELEREIAGLKAEAERIAEKAVALNERTGSYECLSAMTEIGGKFG